MPTATGFRYTPPSYLQHRTQKMENRPWSRGSGSSANGSSTSRNGGGGEESSSADDENTGDWKQEDRPIRKHTTLDAHFQSRIDRRKDLYRGILKGNYSAMSDHSGGTSVDHHHNVDDDDLEHSWSVLSNGEEGTTASAGGVSTEQARVARQRRIMLQGAGSSSDHCPSPSPSLPTGLRARDSEAARVRNMRAQRLRTAKKLAPEEDSLSEKLRQRRLEQREQERLDEERKRQEEQDYWNEQQRIERERAELAEERRLLEAAKRAVAKDEQERRRSRPPTPPGDESSSKQRNSSSRAPRKAVKRSSFHRSASGREPSLFEEVQMLLRESGLIKTCVVGCFGGEANGNVETFDEPETHTRRNDQQHSLTFGPSSRRRSSRSTGTATSCSSHHHRHDLELSEESGTSSSSSRPKY